MAQTWVHVIPTTTSEGKTRVKITTEENGDTNSAILNDKITIEFNRFLIFDMISLNNAVDIDLLLFISGPGVTLSTINTPCSSYSHFHPLQRQSLKQFSHPLNAIKVGIRPLKIAKFATFNYSSDIFNY